MALLQSHLIYPVVMGCISVGQSFVTYSEVMDLALKDVCNGLLIDQMSEMIDLHSSACLKEIPREGKLKIKPQKKIVWDTRAKFGICI